MSTLALASVFVISAFSSPSAAELGKKLIHSVSLENRSRLCLPVKAPDRQQWGRSPSRRPGLELRLFIAAQKSTLEALLATVLSERGRLEVLGIRSEQDHFTATESDMGRDAYWLAFYGLPGDADWAWRLGGHHVSIHVTYQGDRVRSVSPLFLGGERESGPPKRFEGFERLIQRDRLIRQIGAIASQRRFAAMKLDGTANGPLEWSEPMRPLAPVSPGLSIGALDESGRKLVGELAQEFTGAFAAELAAKLMAKFEAGRANGVVALRGSVREGDSYYFRLHAGGLLIECANSGSHLHSILRTDEDFGQ